VAGKILRVAWLIVVALLVLGGSRGGDTGILCWWLFLVWTVPFGVIWYFKLYDLLLPLAPEPYLNYFGVAAVIVATYLFWFVALPRVSRWSRRRRADAANLS
jgi:hypothetical protein